MVQLFVCVLMLRESARRASEIDEKGGMRLERVCVVGERGGMGLGVFCEWGGFGWGTKQT